MPQLPVYTAPHQDLPMPGGRRAQASDYYVPNDLGKTIAHTAESALSFTEDQEARTSLIASSELRAKYARELDAAAISGADVGQLKEQMQEEFSKVGENFQTRKGQQSLQLYTSNTSLMFDEQANRITVQRAGSQARLDGSRFLNSTAALLQNNPGYLKTAEADASVFAQTLTGVSPQAKAEMEDHLHKELNMAAAISSARLDPLGTRKKLDAGEWNLTPEQRQTAVNKADTEHRAARAEDEYLRAAAERDRRDRDNDARDKHFAAIMEPGLPVKSIQRAIMDDADLRPETREHLITFMEHRAKELKGQEKKSDPVVMRDLWLRIHTDPTDPRKIYDGTAIFEAVKAGQINTPDANTLNTLVAGQKDDNNRTFGTRLGGRMQVVQAVMRGSPEYSNQPELSASIQLEIMSRVEKKASELRAAQKSPDGLLDPESKDYFFQPGTIKAIANDVKAQAAALQPKIVTVTSQEEYDALEPNTPYRDSKGNQGVKKGAAKKPAVQRVTGRIE